MNFRIGEPVFWRVHEEVPAVKGGKLVSFDPLGLSSVWSREEIVFVFSNRLFNSAEKALGNSKKKVSLRDESFDEGEALDHGIG